MQPHLVNIQAARPLQWRVWMLDFTERRSRRRKTSKRRSAIDDPYTMPGLDMRSPVGRRFRDIVDSIYDAHAGASLDAARVRELAGLKLSLEQTQAAVIGGDGAAREDLVRLANLVTRKERDLKAAADLMRTKPSTFRDRLLAGSLATGEAR